MSSFSTTPTDTDDISDVAARATAILRVQANTVQISATKARPEAIHVRLSNTLNVTNFARGDIVFVSNTIDISNTVSVTGLFVQYDTWRPVTNPHNTVVLVCRTPLGDHDTDLTGMQLWTVRPDGSMERKEIGPPAENGFGWDAYGHPEWSPDGQSIVVAAETATHYKLAFIASSGFGTT